MPILPLFRRPYLVLARRAELRAAPVIVGLLGLGLLGWWLPGPVLSVGCWLLSAALAARCLGARRPPASRAAAFTNPRAAAWPRLRRFPEPELRVNPFFDFWLDSPAEE